MHRKLSKQDYELLAAFRSSLRHFLRFSENAAEQAGVTPQQHQSLLAIKGFPGRDYVTVGELAERLQILHHSAVGLANRLVRDHLIERSRNPGDHRQVYLRLTPHGEAILEKLSATHHTELQRLGPEFQHLLSQVRRAQKKRPSPKPR